MFCFYVLLILLGDWEFVVKLQGEGVMQSYAPKRGGSNTELNAVLTGKKVEKKMDRESGGEATDENRASRSSQEGERDEPSGTPHERSFFHVLLLLVCFIFALLCYFSDGVLLFVVQLSIYLTMMLTNWGKTNGNVLSDGSESVAMESMWFKILSQWIFIAMYLRILQLAYIEHEENTVH